MIRFDSTCDVTRSDAVAGSSSVPCRLTPRGPGSLRLTVDYTHVLLVPPTSDLRDDFTPGSATFGSASDRVYVPGGSTAVRYRVVLVRRVGRGTPDDHKECLLIRDAVTWPTDEV